MKRLSLIVVSSLLAVALMFGSLAIQANQAHATTVTNSTATKTAVPSAGTPSLHQFPSWVIKANPYIYVSNQVATIDPGINRVLSKGDISKVKQAVQKYNALSSQVKSAVPVNMATNKTIQPGSCRAIIYGPYRYWWGSAYTFNHCIISEMWLFYYDAGAAGVISLVCGVITAGACTIVMGVIGIAITTYISALQGADSQCNNRGANLDIPSVGAPFVNAVC